MHVDWTLSTWVFVTMILLMAIAEDGFEPPILRA